MEAPAADAGRLRVAVSVAPQAWFVERLGGERVAVEVMIPPGASDEDPPLAPRKVAALSQARVYVAVGHPAFVFEQRRILPFLADLPGVSVVDMSRGVASDADDPHIWVSPGQVAVAAGNIAEGLAAADPDGAGVYRANLARFRSEVASLDRRLAERLAPCRGRSFMVYHPSWGAFARRYGLVQVAIEEEGKEPSGRRLVRLIEGAERQGVKVIFVQRGFPRKSAQVIADALGGRTAVADPLEPDWPASLLRVADSLREAYSPLPGGSHG